MHDLMGTEWVGNIGFVKRTDGVIEVYNKKDEMLGTIYYYKKWKKWVWEQGKDIIMTWDCQQKVVDKTKSLAVKVSNKREK